MYIITINDKTYKTFLFFSNRTTEIGILTYNLNLNTMKNKAYCNWFYVPDDKFMEFWGNDVVSFEPTEGGWIFWVLN